MLAPELPPCVYEPKISAIKIASPSALLFPFHHFRSFSASFLDEDGFPPLGRRCPHPRSFNTPRLRRRHQERDFAPHRPGKHFRLYRSGCWNRCVVFFPPRSHLADVPFNPAGLALASRLSEDPSKTTLVLEAGSLELDNTAILIPGEAGSALGTSIDWGFSTAPQEHAQGRSVYWPRGKVRLSIFCSERIVGLSGFLCYPGRWWVVCDQFLGADAGRRTRVRRMGGARERRHLVFCFHLKFSYYRMDN